MSLPAGTREITTVYILFSLNSVSDEHCVFLFYMMMSFWYLYFSYSLLPLSTLRLLLYLLLCSIFGTVLSPLFSAHWRFVFAFI